MHLGIAKTGQNDRFQMRGHYARPYKWSKAREAEAGTVQRKASSHGAHLSEAFTADPNRSPARTPGQIATHLYRTHSLYHIFGRSSIHEPELVANL